MELRKTLLVGAAAIALWLPAIAHAQAVTPTVTHTNGGAGSTSLTVATPGATTVGGVLEVFAGFYGTGGQTATITDASGNTWTQESTKVSSDNTVFWVRAPVTVAAGSAENVTITFSGSVNYDFLQVIYLPPISGYTYGGVDFVATPQSGSSGTMTLSGTASQANDLLLSGVADDPTANGGSQTVLYDSPGLGDWTSYSQPASSGSVSQSYTLGGDTAGVMIAEKVTSGSTPLSVSVSPTSFEPAACPMTNGALVAQATASGGDGNAITWSLGTGGTNDPSLSINPSTGAILSNGSSTVCGNSYTTTVTGSQS